MGNGWSSQLAETTANGVIETGVWLLYVKNVRAVAIVVLILRAPGSKCPRIRVSSASYLAIVYPLEYHVMCTGGNPNAASLMKRYS